MEEKMSRKIDTPFSALTEPAKMAIAYQVCKEKRYEVINGEIDYESFEIPDYYLP